jgi:hypothetical protein
VAMNRGCARSGRGRYWRLAMPPLREIASRTA